MKLRADRATLAAAAADAGRALPTRPTAPILNGVLIDAGDDGQVTLTGYDFDTCIRATITADVLDPGRVLVPGRRLADFLSALPNGAVELDESAARLAIVMPRTRCGLATLLAEDYPSPPPLPALLGVVDAADLAHAVAKVAPAARPVEGLGWSQHLALQANADRLTLYATDRYTIGVSGAAWAAEGPAEPVEVTVDVRALTDGLRNTSGPVAVHADDTGIAFVAAGRTLISRRYDEDYPVALQVIARRPAPTATVDVNAADLADVMARAGKVIGADRTPVQLDIGPEGIRYTATAGDGGTDGELDVEQFDGEPITVGVNPHYMRDALKAFGDAVVTIGLGPELKPLLLRSATSPDDVQVVMPIRPPVR